MSAESGFPAPVVPMLMVVSAQPHVQALSPRTLATFMQNLHKFGEIVELLQKSGKSIGDNLNQSAASLECSAVTIENKIRLYEQDNAIREEHCKHLQTLLKNLTSEMDIISRQLEEATKAAHASEKEKQALMHSLETQKAELAQARKALHGWAKACQDANEKCEDESNKRQEAEKRACDKELEALVCKNELQTNREVNSSLMSRLRDRVHEYHAMQAQNQALQAEIELHRLDKSSLEQAARQHKAILQQKEHHIQAQGQRIQGLEGRIKEQRGDVAHIQKQVDELKQGQRNQSAHRASESMKKISRIALAVLIALGVALTVALVIWLNPSLGSLFNRAALVGGAVSG